MNISINKIINADLYLMHCVSIYPQDYSEANLPKMKKLMSNCFKENVRNFKDVPLEHSKNEPTTSQNKPKTSQNALFTLPI